MGPKNLTSNGKISPAILKRFVIVVLVIWGMVEEPINKFTLQFAVMALGLL